MRRYVLNKNNRWYDRKTGRYVDKVTVMVEKSVPAYKGVISRKDNLIAWSTSIAIKRNITYVQAQNILARYLAKNKLYKKGILKRKPVRPKGVS